MKRIQVKRLIISLFNLSWKILKYTGYKFSSCAQNATSSKVPKKSICTFSIILFIIIYFDLPVKSFAYTDNSFISQIKELTPAKIKSNNPATLTPDVITEQPNRISESNVIHSNQELFLSGAVLLFGVLVLLLEFILVRNLGKDVKSQDFLNLFTVTLIIVGTLFLISSGISSNQIAPALGLYGTIVGYLLGRESERQFRAKNENQSDKDVDIKKEKNNE